MDGLNGRNSGIFDHLTKKVAKGTSYDEKSNQKNQNSKNIVDLTKLKVKNQSQNGKVTETMERILERITRLETAMTSSNLSVWNWAKLHLAGRESLLTTNGPVAQRHSTAAVTGVLGSNPTEDMILNNYLKNFYFSGKQLENYENALTINPQPGLRRIKIFGDGSCLFTSVGRSCMDTVPDRTEKEALVKDLQEHVDKVNVEMRALVARKVIENKDNRFSKIILGGISNKEYAYRIQQPRSLGGYLELVIFADHFDVTFKVITVDENGSVITISQ